MTNKQELEQDGNRQAELSELREQEMLVDEEIEEGEKVTEFEIVDDSNQNVVEVRWYNVVLAEARAEELEGDHFVREKGEATVVRDE